MEVEEFIEDLEGIIKETGKPLRLQQDKIIITIIITDKAERKIMEKSNNEIPIKTSEIKEILNKHPENPQEKLKELIEFKKDIKEKVFKVFPKSQLNLFKIK